MGFGGWVALKKIGTEWFFSFLKLIKFSDNFCILQYNGEILGENRGSGGGGGSVKKHLPFSLSPMTHCPSFY